MWRFESGTTLKKLYVSCGPCHTNLGEPIPKRTDHHAKGTMHGYRKHTTASANKRHRTLFEAALEVGKSEIVGFARNLQLEVGHGKGTESLEESFMMINKRRSGKSCGF